MKDTIGNRMNSAWEATERFYPRKYDSLAQAYIDAEERALAADGDVLDAEDFDPEVDEVDASEAVGAWEDGDGQFKFVLEAE